MAHVFRNIPQINKNSKDLMKLSIHSNYYRKLFIGCKANARSMIDEKYLNNIFKLKKIYLVSVKNPGHISLLRVLAN